MVHRILLLAAMALAAVMVVVCEPAAAQPGPKGQKSLEAEIERLRSQLRELEEAIRDAKSSGEKGTGKKDFKGEGKKGDGKKGDGKKGFDFKGEGKKGF